MRAIRRRGGGSFEGMPGQPKTWVVDFDSDAVLDFEDVKSRGDRKAVYNVVQKHGRRFVVLAVAPKKKDFDRAVAEAGPRLSRHRDC